MTRVVKQKNLHYFCLVSLLLLSGCRSKPVPREKVFIPSGEATLGLLPEDNTLPAAFWGLESAFIQRKMMLDAFYIDKYEVTQAEFAVFLNINGNQIEGEKIGNREALWYQPPEIIMEYWPEVLKDTILPEISLSQDQAGAWQATEAYSNYPINQVSWYGAQSYCKWLGGELPTEAQWEKAARSGAENYFPWGNSPVVEGYQTFLGSQITNKKGAIVGPFYNVESKFNYCDSNCSSHYDYVYGNDQQTVMAAVDFYEEDLTKHGAVGMIGNVAEWVLDIDSAALYPKEYKSRSDDLHNAPIEITDTHKAFIKGASFQTFVYHTATYLRDINNKTANLYSVGFRCAYKP